MLYTHMVSNFLNALGITAGILTGAVLALGILAIIGKILSLFTNRG